MNKTFKAALTMDRGYFFLRFTLGLMMALAHGYGKITAGPELWGKVGGAMGIFGITFAPVFWGFMAAFAESIAALAVAAGVFTRYSAALVAFTMFVAGAMHLNNGDGFGKASNAIGACLAFIGILIAGGGRLSFDYKFCKSYRKELK
jgi:putative oxidoreductase